MDAVELTLPVDVAATPKLMGSEGFVRARVTVKELEARPPGSDRVSVVVSNSTESCKPLLIENDVANMREDAEVSSRSEFLESQLYKNSSHFAHSKGEDVSKNMSTGKGKNCSITTSRLEGTPSQQKVAKAIKISSSSLKRPRMSQPYDPMSLNVIEESKDISDKLGSRLMNCTSLEKIQLPNQKSSTSKRGDKRNFKVPSAKSKYELSSIKSGASIFSSACGGNNYFGLYGLKHDIHDVTKLMDEPPLDELLRGTFDILSLSKDKGKKASSTSEGFLNSVRKACSVIQFPKSVQSQNMDEMDCTSNKKMSTFQLNSVCGIESSGNGDKEQSFSADMSSCQKDPCSETESTASLLDFPLCQPKDVLERIALCPFRDLDSLLLDVSKPALTTKTSNDQRSGKQVPRRPSLPAFAWSNAFASHLRSNSDTVKLSTSRSTCQGKWARIGVIASSMNVDCGCFTNLDSVSYDERLVPSTNSSDQKVSPSFSGSLPILQWNSSSPVTSSKDSQVNAAFGGQVDAKEKDELSPKALAAAQVLCEMATHSPNPDGNLRWKRKTSRRALKGRNFKSNESRKEKLSTPNGVIGPELLTGRVEQIMLSKKPRLSVVENKNGDHSNNVKKGPCAWPTSKSSRSSLLSKPVRDSIMENKHSSASILKQHSMMHPSGNVFDKSYEGQQRVGKSVFPDWKRGRDKSD